MVADFERALNTKDIALYKSLRPGLSADEERRVRESFKIKVQVALSVVGVEVDPSGGRATVHVTRQDTVDGKPMPSRQRAFQLVQRDGTWTIQSLGQ